MAGLKRARDIDYKQLDSFTSVVLYDTVPSKKKAGRLYVVERVITRRRVRYVSITLIVKLLNMFYDIIRSVIYLFSLHHRGISV